MKANGKARFDIYRYVKRLISGLPFVRLVAPPLDRAVARLTGGRHTLTSLLTGLPTVQLTTTGARSGQPRSVILVGMPSGEDVVLIASNWGQERHPAWYHNLRANPRAILAAQGQAPQPYVAREATGDERRELWDRAVQLYPGYTRYARRTAPRQIPVLVLSPAKSVPNRQNFG